MRDAARMSAASPLQSSQSAEAARIRSLTSGLESRAPALHCRKQFPSLGELSRLLSFSHSLAVMLAGPVNRCSRRGVCHAFCPCGARGLVFSASSLIPRCSRKVRRPARQPRCHGDHAHGRVQPLTVAALAVKRSPSPSTLSPGTCGRKPRVSPSTRRALYARRRRHLRRSIPRRPHRRRLAAPDDLRSIGRSRKPAHANHQRALRPANR